MAAGVEAAVAAGAERPDLGSGTAGRLPGPPHRYAGHTLIIDNVDTLLMSSTAGRAPGGPSLCTLYRLQRFQPFGFSGIELRLQFRSGLQLGFCVGLVGERIWVA